MADDAVARPVRGWRWLLYVAPALVWLLLSIPNAELPGESGAESAGRVVGAAVVPLLVALLLRALYVKVLARRRQRPVWSPWIFVIAAALALLVACGRVASREAERQEARSLVEDASGSHSEDVVDCVDGALDSMEDADSASLPFSPAQSKRIFVRVCQEAERRGLDRRGKPPTPRELVPLVEDVVAEMRARGELPRG